MDKRLKVLVSCYACSPIRGSEPGMGWGFVEALSKYHDLWVITEEEKFRPEIELELEERPELREKIKFFYIAKTRHRTLRKIWPPSYYWFYRAWQKRAFEVAKQLHEQIHFDVIHQLNMVGFREPGYLWKLDAPYVWGPIGGMGTLPWRFLHTLGLYGFAYHLAKNVVNVFQTRLLYRPRLAARKAAALIAATPDVRQNIAAIWGRDSTVICEVGPPAGFSEEPRPRLEGEPLRLVWSGLHIPRKALNLLLKALSQVNQQMDWRLDIIGSGPRSRAWQSLCGRLGIAERCTWHGWILRDQAMNIVCSSHLGVITSLADLTSSVTLEYFAAGLPIVCLDHCGFGDIVTKDCGIKIAVGSPSQVARDLAVAIEGLWRDEPYRCRLASGAIRRVAECSWEKKGEVLNALYERVVSSHCSAGAL